jgi:hypothetical protein
MSVGEFNPETIEALASCTYSFRKLKVANPVAIPIHLTHEYLARSNNNRHKGTESFVGNLLSHSSAPNVRLKLLADNPRVLLIVRIVTINPIADRTGSEFTVEI